MTMKFQKLCEMIAATDLYIALQSQHQSEVWKQFQFNIFANEKSSSSQTHPPSPHSAIPESECLSSDLVKNMPWYSFKAWCICWAHVRKKDWESKMKYIHCESYCLSGLGSKEHVHLPTLVTMTQISKDRKTLPYSNMDVSLTRFISALNRPYNNHK